MLLLPWHARCKCDALGAFSESQFKSAAGPTASSVSVQPSWAAIAFSSARLAGKGAPGAVSASPTSIGATSRPARRRLVAKMAKDGARCTSARSSSVASSAVIDRDCSGINDLLGRVLHERSELEPRTGEEAGEQRRAILGCVNDLGQVLG
jgi:hypothetical protein